MQARKIVSSEIDRRYEQAVANIARQRAYEQRKQDNPSLVLLGSAQRCKWLRRQAD